MKSFLLTVFLICYSLILKGQATPKSFYHYTIKDGLPNNGISCIVRDSYGFIWIGTDNGLCQFNGSNFKSYRYSENDTLSISSNSINRIFVDSKGRLWVCTMNGLCLYYAEKEQFKRIHPVKGENFNSSSSVTGIAEDNRQNIYFQTENGKVFYLDKDYLITPLLDLQLKGSKVMKIDRQGNFWITDKNNIYTYNPKTNVTKSFKLGKGNEYDDIEIREMLFIDSIVYFGAYKSNLIKYNINTNTYCEINIGYSNLNSVGLAKDEKNNLWIGASIGLVYYDTKKDELTYFRKNPTDKYSTYPDAIGTIIYDQNKTLWAGSTKGLYVAYETKAFESFSFGNGSLTNDNGVNAIIKTKKGNLWLGYTSGVIEILDDNYQSIRTIASIDNLKPKKTISEIFSLAEDKDANIWIGTYNNGLIKYNPASNKFKQFYPDGQKNSISYSDIRSICIDNKGLLWLAVHSRGLEYYDSKQSKFVNISDEWKDILPSGIGLNWPFKVITDNNQNIWIGASDGILKFNITEKAYRIFQNIAGQKTILPENFIKGACCDKYNRIWFITNSGIAVYDQQKDTIHLISKNNGLIDNITNSIIEDNNGIIWVGTQNGLSKIYFSKNADSLNITNYKESDGIFNCNFHRNSAFKDSNGKLYFGNSDGFVTFFPDSIRDGNADTKIIFTDLEIYGEKVPMEKDKMDENSYGIYLKKNLMFLNELTFKESHKVISIYFTELNNILQGNVDFVFRIKELNKTWIPIKNGNVVTLTSLPSGNYTLEVYTQNKNGKIFGEGASIKIKILPLFWKTNIAFIIYIAIIILIIFWIRKIALDRQRIIFESHQQEELNTIKTRFFVDISHELKTPLTLISSPIKQILEDYPRTTDNKIEVDSNLIKVIHRNTQRLLRILGQIMDLRRIELNKSDLKVVEYDIVAFANSLIDYFNFQVKNKQLDIKLSSNLPEILFYFDPDKMDKVFFNIISNSLRYTPNEGTIQINIEKLKETKKFKINQTSVNEYIKISIIDNGIGIPQSKVNQMFERFNIIGKKTENRSQSSGIGLSITKSLIDLMQGEIEVESKSLEDGYKQTGTSFFLYFKCGKNHFSPEQIYDDAAFGNDIVIQNKLAKLPAENTEILEQESNIGLINGKPKLLIIDDDIEIQDYLKNQLSDQYNVTIAYMGEDGLRIAKKEFPDLIICDIMMPGISGFDVCETIKKNHETSHIPVLLLTARTEDTDEVSANKYAADAFVKKPFNINILKSQINSLILNRRKLRESFLSNYGINLNMVVPTSSDERFIKKLFEIIEKHISNPELDVDLMTAEIGMSRTLLYKKVNSLANTSVKLFIRSVRLKKAAELLSTSDMSITDIAYEVGFSTLPYFSKCFQEEFKISPSKYAATHHINPR